MNWRRMKESKWKKNLDVYINLEIYTFGPCNYKTNELGKWNISILGFLKAGQFKTFLNFGGFFFLIWHIRKKNILPILVFHKPALGSVRSHTKFGSDWFSRFDFYWIQNKQTSKVKLSDVYKCTIGNLFRNLYMNKI